MKFEKGNVILIGENKFDVISVLGEIDWYDSKKDEYIGEHLEVGLHIFNSKVLHATHVLKIYNKDNFKVGYLYDFVQNKPLKLERLKTRGNIISYKNERKILLKDVKILS